MLQSSSCPSLSYPGPVCFPPTPFLAAYSSVSLRRENGEWCCLCLGHLTSHLKTVSKLSFNKCSARKVKGENQTTHCKPWPEKCQGFSTMKVYARFLSGGMLSALDKSVLSVYHPNSHQIQIVVHHDRDNQRQTPYPSSSPLPGIKCYL